MFLLLTPILVLAVVALVGFAGCGLSTGGLGGVFDPPGNLFAVAGDGSVVLIWEDVNLSTADSYNVKRGTTMGGPYPDVVSVPGSPTTFTDTTVTDGTTYYYVVTAIITGDETDPSNEVSATPAAGLTAFVTSEVLGTQRDTPFTGLAGMQIQLGAASLTITALGRWVSPDNSQPHMMQIVDAMNNVIATATIPAGGPEAGFNYASLDGAPATLTGGATYYVVSAENTTGGGDTFYDQDTTVTTTDVATVTAAVTQPSGSTTFDPVAGSAGRTLGPLDFQYEVVQAPPPPPKLTAFVTSEMVGTPRNMANQPFTGWAGMEMKVASALTIKTLGRFVAPGNAATHALKIVDAATGVDVPNASATVNTAGQTAGAFVYASLPTPVTLTAGASYYIVSHEDTSTAAGDTFYDLDTTIKTTAVATVTFAIYEFDAPPGFNQSAMASPPNAFTFGPVDFQY